MRLVIVLLVASLAGCIADDNPAEPGAQPPNETSHEVVSFDWTHEAFLLQGALPINQYVVIPEGNVHRPDGDGPFPTLVFQHGRHATCRYADTLESLSAVCLEQPPVMEPVDSFRGYDYLAEHLAAAGFVVVSVDANEVNDRDNENGLLLDDYGATARARLIAHVLGLIADDDPAFQGLAAVADLDNLGLMGHSRGGEGVARYESLAKDEGFAFPADAIFALAPINVGSQAVGDVPFATLLPYCDGDVFNLAGATMYDDNRGAAAPLHQFLALGANHNWYNTYWPGSDWTNRGDPHCDLDSGDSGRNTFEEQMAEGIDVIGGFFQAYLGDDAASLARVTGSVPLHEDVVASYHPRPADRMDLGLPSGPLCAPADCPNQPTYARAEAVHVELPLQWSWLLPEGYDRFSFRVALPPMAPTHATVTFATCNGPVILPAGGGWFSPPGDSGAKSTYNMVAFDIPVCATEVTLNATGSGSAQFVDVMVHRLP